MKHFLFTVCLVICMAFSMQSHATLPSELKVKEKTWRKVGAGQYRVLFTTIYDIALYTPDGRYDARTPHALSIRYDMAFSADEINERSLDEMNRTGGVSDGELQQYQKQLGKLMPSVEQGDILTAVFVPTKEMRLYKNAQPQGRTVHTSLIEAFAGIWLAGDTNAPDLRSDLLGL